MQHCSITVVCSNNYLERIADGEKVLDEEKILTDVEDTQNPR